MSILHLLTAHPNMLNKNNHFVCQTQKEVHMLHDWQSQIPTSIKGWDETEMGLLGVRQTLSSAEHARLQDRQTASMSVWHGSSLYKKKSSFCRAAFSTHQHQHLATWIQTEPSLSSQRDKCYCDHKA